MSNQDSTPQGVLPNDAETLRRAATAARNMQHTFHDDWFSWVPRYLIQLADRLDGVTESSDVNPDLSGDEPSDPESAVSV